MEVLSPRTKDNIFKSSRYYYIVGATTPWGQDIVDIGEKLESTMKNTDFLNNAPFIWLDPCVIFQLRNLDCFGTIALGRIRKKYMSIDPCIYPDYRIFHAVVLFREILLDFYKLNLV
jgi:hypothetical protein